MAIKDKIYEKQHRSRKHIHTYKKINVGTLGMLWKCIDPYCNHYMPKHQESLLIGRMSLCVECGQELVLDEEMMKIDSPLCIDCRTKQIGIDLEDFDQFIESKETWVDKFK